MWPLLAHFNQKLGFEVKMLLKMLTMDKAKESVLILQ